MKRHTHWRRIAYAMTFFVALFALTVYWTVYSVATTGNRVGTILTTIGLIVIGLAVVFAYYGSLEIDEHSVLWQKEKVYASHGAPEWLLYPFHLEEPSVVRGNISGTTGPYKFFLTEFYGTAEEMYQGPQIVKPRTYLKGKGLEKSDIGPLGLPPGNYVLKFGEYRELEALFSLKKTVRKKPYEEYYGVGLTLLEVGIPVLITGVISLAFGTLVP